jgi:hypothetical protein
MKVKVSEASGPVLDWMVAKSIGEYRPIAVPNYSTDWAQGGPIIEKANITLIRANDTYGTDEKGYCNNVRIPQWFAECSQWTGHNIATSYEGECMDPTFMIPEDGQYGPTPLIAAVRCYVASKLGEEVEVPDGLI